MVLDYDIFIYELRKYNFFIKGFLRGFAQFKSISWGTDLWVTLGGFTVKNAKVGKGKIYLTENRLCRNEMWCAADNNNYMCQICAKGFLDSNFN